QPERKIEVAVGVIRRPSATAASVVPPPTAAAIGIADAHEREEIALEALVAGPFGDPAAIARLRPGTTAIATSHAAHSEATGLRDDSGDDRHEDGSPKEHGLPSPCV